MINVKHDPSVDITKNTLLSRDSTFMLVIALDIWLTHRTNIVACCGSMFIVILLKITCIYCIVMKFPLRCCATIKPSMINRAFRLLRCSINSSLVKQVYLLSSLSASCMSVDPRESTQDCVVKLVLDRKCNSLLVRGCISLVGSG